MNKQFIASELRSAIEYYAELTANEQMTQRLDPEATLAWKNVEKLINQLVEEV